MTPLAQRCLDALASSPVSFRALRRPNGTALMHRSTAQANRWQVTFFDDDQPVGHVEGDDYARLLHEARMRGVDFETVTTCDTETRR